MVVWAIASADPLQQVEQFRDALGLELPILYDAGGVVHQDYVQTAAFPSAAYPQQWVIGTDGNIAWSKNEYDVGELRAVIEAELAGY